MQSTNENQAEATPVVPPLGRTPSENVKVRKEQQGAVQFCARLGRTPTETHELLGSAYQEDALRKTVTKTYHKRFQNLGVDVYKSNTKAKKAKPTTDKKPCIDGVKSKENGDEKAESGEQEAMNVEQGTEEKTISSNGEGEPKPQSESTPQETKEESIQKTTDEGSAQKVESTPEA